MVSTTCCTDLHGTTDVDLSLAFRAVTSNPFGKELVSAAFDGEGPERVDLEGFRAHRAVRALAPIV